MNVILFQQPSIISNWVAQFPTIFSEDVVGPDIFVPDIFVPIIHHQQLEASGVIIASVTHLIIEEIHQKSHNAVLHRVIRINVWPVSMIRGNLLPLVTHRWCTHPIRSHILAPIQSRVGEGWLVSCWWCSSNGSLKANCHILRN